MESITSTLAEIVKKRRGPYDTAEKITENILRQAASFASELYMPNLSPIMEAVCCYARTTANEEKVEAALETMEGLNDLAMLINRYGELLEILEWLDGRRIALSKEEGNETEER